MSETPTVRPGQVYESCESHWDSYSDERPKIRVVGEPFNSGTAVDIVTVTDDGREMRRRRIMTSQLHTSGTTKDGKPRRTGYRLIQEAPDHG